MASTGRKHTKKSKVSEEPSHHQAFDFNIKDEAQCFTGSDDEAREGTIYLFYIGYTSWLLIKLGYLD